MRIGEVEKDSHCLNTSRSSSNVHLADMKKGHLIDEVLPAVYV